MLVWHHKRPDPAYRTPKHIIEYYELEQSKKYFCEIKESTVSLWHIFWLKLTGKIRGVTDKEYQAIKNYGFFEMVEASERKSMANGWTPTDKPTLPFKAPT